MAKSQSTKREQTKKTNETPKKKMGAPIKYKPEYVQLAKYMALAGLTDQQIASELKITRSTLAIWKITYPEFGKMLSDWKAVADEKVERSLYERAIGFSHPDVDIKVIEGKIVETPLIRYFPPDSTAAIFWLKNRDPKRWRDRQEVGVDGDVKINLIRKIVK